MNSQLLQNSNVPSIRTSLRSLIPAYQLKELIIQKLINVWEHYPQAIDETIFRHAELLFVLTTDEFKQQRTQKHLLRMIFSLFFIQKSLRKLVIHLGENRHLDFRLVQTCLKFPFGTKPVLSFMGGICLFDKQENFEERHLLLAAQKLIPEIQIVKGTTLLHHDPEDSIRLIYTEFEKKSGGTFTISEIALLKRGLQTELHSRVEKKIPSPFMMSHVEGEWNQEKQKRQVARLAIRNVPASFDPRLGGDSNSRTLLKMLFEGLMRMGQDGKPTYALAQSVTLSNDKKTYIFHLRSSFWSDGSPLIAYDFEYAWKKILSPKFTTPFASFFNSIQNAHAVKEGSVPHTELGVESLDEHSLKVTLDYPTPYFLELTTLPLFSPISHKVDWIHPNWTFQDGDDYVCNGPFCLKRKNLNYGYELIKNLNYWDVNSIKLDQILIRKIKDSSVYELFENHSIDWIGHTMPYWAPSSAKRYSSQMSSRPSPKVSWCVFNTQQFPFHSPKIRKALSYCIDKEKLLSLLNYEDATPATSPLPLSHSLQASISSWKFDSEYAQKMLAEGLLEIGINKNDFPEIILLSPLTALYEPIAKFIKKCWEDILGISCRIFLMEWTELFPKICKGDFDVSLITWTSWINDPMYTLNSFKYQKDEVNFSKWENLRFQKLLDQACAEEEPSQSLKEAEKILIDEMPVNPLFFENNHCISQDYFHAPCDPLFGDPDFKLAYIRQC